MRKYEIVAEYHVTKILTVEVKEGGDPSNAADWARIVHEDDSDCRLWNVLSYEENYDE